MERVSSPAEFEIPVTLHLACCYHIGYRSNKVKNTTLETAGVFWYFNHYNMASINHPLFWIDWSLANTANQELMSIQTLSLVLLLLESISAAFHTSSSWELHHQPNLLCLFFLSNNAFTKRYLPFFIMSKTLAWAFGNSFPGTGDPANTEVLKHHHVFYWIPQTLFALLCTVLSIFNKNNFPAHLLHYTLFKR